TCRNAPRTPCRSTRRARGDHGQTGHKLPAENRWPAWVGRIREDSRRGGKRCAAAFVALSRLGGKRRACAPIQPPSDPMRLPTPRSSLTPSARIVSGYSRRQPHFVFDGSESIFTTHTFRNCTG